MKLNREEILSRLQQLGVTTPDQCKRAALLFDRLWVPTLIWTNYQQGTGASTGRTVTAQFNDLEIPSELTFGDLALDQGITSASSIAAYRRDDGALEITGDGSERHKIYNTALRPVAASYHARGVTVTPVYPSEEMMHAEILDGPSIAYEASLENIPLIDNEATGWDEILEFRKDKRAAYKVRRLRSWLEEGLKCTSAAHASDIIGARIDDYSWALKKHGLKTATGAVSCLLGSGTAALIAKMLDRPLWQSITCGLTLAGATWVWVKERLIDREDAVRGANSEVAILYEAQKRFGSERDKTD